MGSDQSSDQAGAIAGADLAIPGGSVGRFVVERVLGSGERGVVLAAHDPTLGRKVALKLVRPEAGERARLKSEAEALARVQHPNVVTVYEVGTAAEQLFVAMELVDGQNLAGWLADPSRGQGEVLAMLAAAGRGLQAVHEAGLVHRDFKPDNVLVGGDGRPRVSDFGVTTGTASRNAPYLSPEEERGEPGDARSDQYAFAATLREALTGRGVLPRRLERVIARALSPRPEDRFPSMGEMLASLERPRPAAARLAAVTALLLVGLVGLGGWLQTRHSAVMRAQRARELAQQVEQLRASMRAAHLLPMHDIKSDRDRLRAQVKLIEAQADRLGAEGHGAVEYALGAGYFGIGEAATARKHLEAAWAAGERSPNLAYDLGRLLANLFDREMYHLPPDPAERKQRVDELQRTLRDPAVAYLKQAAGAADTSPEYIEEMIAFTEVRVEDTIRHGEAAFAAQPVLYQAGVILASSYMRRGRALALQGEKVQARALQEKSEKLYQRVAEIARSDEMVYKLYADGLGAAVWARHLAGQDIAADLEHVASLCRQGQAVDSEAAWPDEILARTWAMAGDDDHSHQRDPRPHFHAAIEATERALKRNPRSTQALTFQGDAWGMLVDDWETDHGEDPRPSLKKSIESYEAANRIAPTADAYLNVGVSRMALANWEMAHGIDAGPTIEALVRNYEDGMRSRPEEKLSVHSNICRALARYARDRIEHDVDAAALLARAQPACETARKEDPELSGSSNAPAVFEKIQGLSLWKSGGDPLPSWQKSEADLARAIAIDPADTEQRGDRVELLAMRAEYLTSQQKDARKDVERALAEAKQAVARDGKSAAAWRALAVASLAAVRVGRRAQAAEGERAAGQALTIKADDLESMLTLAELYTSQKDARAGALIERALAQSPNLPRALALKAELAKR